MRQKQSHSRANLWTSRTQAKGHLHGAEMGDFGVVLQSEQVARFLKSLRRRFAATSVPELATKGGGGVLLAVVGWGRVVWYTD